MKNRPGRRMRYSNRLKVLGCYGISFGLPLLTAAAGLFAVYPYKLQGSAPLVAETLLSLGLSAGRKGLEAAAAAAAVAEGASPAEWQRAFLERDRQWLFFVGALFLLAWFLTLFLQLLWRGRHARGLEAARNTRAAIRDYRLTQGIVWAVNGLAAALCWTMGVQFIEGRNAWDFLAYFAPYLLNGLAAVACFRLAAPPALSGKRAFFKRL